jgi:hypothetical protein
MVAVRLEILQCVVQLVQRLVEVFVFVGAVAI